MEAYHPEEKYKKRRGLTEVPMETLTLEIKETSKKT